jgi:hypothetical protein
LRGQRPQAAACPDRGECRLQPAGKGRGGHRRQAERGLDSLAIDCDNGEVADMLARGVVDPVPVKMHAIKAAGEVAVAILRIDTIIKKKEEGAGAAKGGAAADAATPDF